MVTAAFFRLVLRNTHGERAAGEQPWGAAGQVEEGRGRGSRIRPRWCLPGPASLRGGGGEPKAGTGGQRRGSLPLDVEAPCPPPAAVSCLGEPSRDIRRVCRRRPKWVYLNLGGGRNKRCLRVSMTSAES